jgi:AraC-like DNA-binding protein
MACAIMPKNVMIPPMSANQIQNHFFAQLVNPQDIRTIFEYLPDIYFFIKDRQSRLIAASSTILQRLGMKSEKEFVGKLDTEVFPLEVAKAYQADDQLVFRTGKPLIKRLELWYDETRTLDWCVTTKVPLRGCKGEIIGLMGITRRDPGKGHQHAQNEAVKAAAYLRKNTHRVLSTKELAVAISVSERTLHRKIRETFDVSPYELILRTRIQAAAEELLKSTSSIVEVALKHGFCDQSTFTQHFRKRMGTTPKRFRMRHLTQ